MHDVACDKAISVGFGAARRAMHNREALIMGTMTKSTIYHMRARDVVSEFMDTLWFLRLILAFQLLVFAVLTIAMYYFGGPVETSDRAPSSFSDTLYFCSITALTIGYGDVVPTTMFGRLDALLLGLLGLLMTGLVIAAAVRSVQETAREIDKRS
jgi:voltage-gated potassium channel